MYVFGVHLAGITDVSTGVGNGVGEEENVIAIFAVHGLVPFKRGTHGVLTLSGSKTLGLGIGGQPDEDE